MTIEEVNVAPIPEEDPGRLPTPYVTIALCSLCVLVTLAHWFVPPGISPSWTRIDRIFNVSGSDIWDGKYYGLLTCVFLHANPVQNLGIAHLLFNMIMLYQLGMILELTIGRAAYLAFVGIAAVVGSCVQLAVTGDMAIGASGVVYAIFGLMWAGRQRHPAWGQVASRQNIGIMVGWAIACLVFTYIGLLSIGNGAHFGGLAFGLCVGGLVYAPRRQWAFAPLIALIVATCVLAVSYMPWSLPWASWKSNQQLQCGNYVGAVHWERRMLALGAPRPVTLNGIAMTWYELSVNDLQRGDVAGARSARAQSSIAAIQADKAEEAAEAKIYK